MERAIKYYSDILLAVELVEQFITDTPDFTKYSVDRKTKSAVERQLVIIGEAINNLRKEEAPELTSGQQIISFRNRLVHAYDSIDDNIVWAILKRHLPLLKKEVEERLK